MKLTGITFITTYNCNANCSHCFFETQGKSVYMDPEIIDIIYTDKSVTEKMFWNHFSGGEVLLKKDVFIEIIKRTRKYFNGSIGISTNGFWADSPEKAHSTVEELKQAGISGMAISTDFYHNEFVSKQNVHNAVDAIINSGLKSHCYIMGARCKPDIVNADLINMESERFAIQAKKDSQIPLAPTFIRSIGKGSNINTPKQETIPQGGCSDLSECLGKRGPMNPAMVWVDPYGNVMLCYGITIGNVYDTPFKQIIERYEANNSEILKKISTHGPKELISLVKEKDVPIPTKFYDECDVCFQLRKALQDEYSELAPTECYP